MVAFIERCMVLEWNIEQIRLGHHHAYSNFLFLCFNALNCETKKSYMERSVQHNY